MLPLKVLKLPPGHLVSKPRCHNTHSLCCKTSAATAQKLETVLHALICNIVNNRHYYKPTERHVTFTVFLGLCSRKTIDISADMIPVRLFSLKREYINFYLDKQTSMDCHLINYLQSRTGEYRPSRVVFVRTSLGSVHIATTSANIPQ